MLCDGQALEDVIVSEVPGDQSHHLTVPGLPFEETHDLCFLSRLFPGYFDIRQLVWTFLHVRYELLIVTLQGDFSTNRPFCKIEGRAAAYSTHLELSTDSIPDQNWGEKPRVPPSLCKRLGTCHRE